MSMFLFQAHPDIRDILVAITVFPWEVDAAVAVM